MRGPRDLKERRKIGRSRGIIIKEVLRLNFLFFVLFFMNRESILLRGSLAVKEANWF